MPGDKKTGTILVDQKPGESLTKKKASNNNAKKQPAGSGFSQIGSSIETEMAGSPHGMQLIQGHGDQMAQMRSFVDQRQSGFSQSAMFDGPVVGDMNAKEQVEQIPKVMNMIESLKAKDNMPDQQSLAEVNSQAQIMQLQAEINRLMQIVDEKQPDVIDAG